MYQLLHNSVVVKEYSSDILAYWAAFAIMRENAPNLPSSHCAKIGKFDTPFVYDDLGNTIQVIYVETTND